MRPALVRIPAIAALLACLVSSAHAQDRVEISGGNDGTGQNYAWTVKNRHTSPIVSIVFPHYQADSFITPDGWKQKCTNLAVIGSENASGECRAYVEPPAPGIAPGASAQFKLRLARVSALRGSGTVTIVFADGTSTLVSGVTVPVAESFLQRLMIPLAMGAIFVAAFLIHALRKRRKEAAKSAAPPDSGFAAG